MKKMLNLLIIIILLSCRTEHNKSELSNDKLLDSNYHKIIDPIQDPAKFKYGLDSISKIIYSNMNLKGEKGKVIVSIEIDSLGNIKNTKIVKSNNEKLNPEALRLVKLIPNQWTPAEIGSQRKKIPSSFNFCIYFDQAIKLLYSE